MDFSLLKKVFNGLMRRYLGTQIIKVHYLGKKIIPQNINVESIVKPLEYNDFLLGDKEEFTPAKLDVIRRRLKDKSYRAYGIFENGKLIYSCWISLEILGLPVILKEPIRLKEKQGYLEDAYCSVQARGRGLHTIMISYRLNKLYDYGKTEGTITVIDGNTPALRANLKSGMNDLGVFYCGKILWCPFCTLSSKKRSIFDSKI